MSDACAARGLAASRQCATSRGARACVDGHARARVPSHEEAQTEVTKKRASSELRASAEEAATLAPSVLCRQGAIAMRPPAVRTAALRLARGALGWLHTSAEAHPPKRRSCGVSTSSSPARRWTARFGESRRIWARAPAVRTEEAARARCYVLRKHRGTKTQRLRMEPNGRR